MGNKRVTTEEFIRRSKLVHGNKFDYSETNYVKSDEKIKIICNKHGLFEQIPHNHLSGRGCLKCQHDSYKLGVEGFINRVTVMTTMKWCISILGLKLRSSVISMDFLNKPQIAILTKNKDVLVVGEIDKILTQRILSKKLIRFMGIFMIIVNQFMLGLWSQ